MTVLQGVAAWVLWQSRQFSTYEIARLLSLPEHEVDRALHIAREAARAGEQC